VKKVPKKGLLVMGGGGIETFKLGRSGGRKEEDAGKTENKQKSRVSYGVGR